MSEWQSYEGQIRLLQDLSSQVNYMKDYLESFKDSYEAQVKKCESLQMLTNYLNPIIQYKLPEYKVKVSESQDELQDFIDIIKNNIDILEDLAADARKNNEQ